MEPLPRFVPLDRMVAFSDGVFAVVITLLVLGIEVPSEAVLTGPELAATREKLLHQLLIYFVAFWLVGMYWSQQSLFTSGLKQIDRGTFVLNLLLLLPITLLPFVTQFMGEMRTDWRAVLNFALTNVFATLVIERMWSRIASLPETQKGPQTATLAARMRVEVRAHAAVMVLGVLVARLDVRAGTLVFVLIPFVHFYNFLRDPFRSRAGGLSSGETK
ncbi:MAG: TMEM175 family protein [Polyangiales bacterium]